MEQVGHFVGEIKIYVEFTWPCTLRNYGHRLIREEDTQVYNVGV